PSNPPPPTAPSTLSLHDALPICPPTSKVSRSTETLRNDLRPWSGSAGTSVRFESDGCSSPGGPRVPTVKSTAYSIRLVTIPVRRSEEHTSELQSRGHLVCRLLLE